MGIFVSRLRILGPAGTATVRTNIGNTAEIDNSPGAILRIRANNGWEAIKIFTTELRNSWNSTNLNNENGLIVYKSYIIFNSIFVNNNNFIELLRRPYQVNSS